MAQGTPPPGFEVRVAGIEIDIPVTGEQLDSVVEPGAVYTFYVLGSVTDLASLQVLPIAAAAAGAEAAGTPVAPMPPLPLAVGTPQAASAP